MKDLQDLADYVRVHTRWLNDHLDRRGVTGEARSRVQKAIAEFDLMGFQGRPATELIMHALTLAAEHTQSRVETQVLLDYARYRVLSLAPNRKERRWLERHWERVIQPLVDSLYPTDEVPVNTPDYEALAAEHDRKASEARRALADLDEPDDPEGEVSEREAELHDLRSAHDDAVDEARKLRHRADELQAQLDALHTQIHDNEALSASIESRIPEARRALESARMAAASVSTEAQSLRDRARHHEQEAARLRRKAST